LRDGKIRGKRHQPLHVLPYIVGLASRKRNLHVMHKPETIGKERFSIVSSWIIPEAQEIARALRELDVTSLSRDLKETASLQGLLDGFDRFFAVQ
jgi:hypothetical protein